MGACTFSDSIKTEDSAEKAYRKLVDAARREFGESGYNGTISTTNGFAIQNKGKPMTDDAAVSKYIDETIDNAEKWGACLALRVETSEFRGWVFYGWAAE